jgi:GAF domain-containing protein
MPSSFIGVMNGMSKLDIDKLSHITIPIPHDEGQRLKALRQTELINSSTDDPMYDRFCSLTKRLFNVPIALISLVEVDKQWYKSNIGSWDGVYTETHRNLSFCAWTVLPESPDVFVVEDATVDVRFCV